jgi:hypothetical protein
VQASVSGRAFLGLVRYIREEHGPKGLDAIVAGTGEETRRVFSDRIRKNQFYPYATYADFLRAADRCFGRGNYEFCRELGAQAGRADLSTVFQIYRKLASPERLIRSCTRVWSSYYRDAGRMDAVTWEPEDTRLRITGFDGMHRAHCHLMEGWMIQAMDLIGCRVNGDAREARCPSRGGPYHEFVCSWTRV